MLNELGVVRDQIDSIDAQLLALLNNARPPSTWARSDPATARPAVYRRSARPGAAPHPGSQRRAAARRERHLLLSARSCRPACPSRTRSASPSSGRLGTFSERARGQAFRHARVSFPRAPSTTCSARSKPAMPSTAWCRSKIHRGAVGRTLTCSLGTPLKICGEVVVRIHQHLMSRETSLGAIRKVFPRPVPAQCHEWLNRSLPGVPRIPVGSNAEAARLCIPSTNTAAIAGEAASRARYDLPRLVESIEDEPNNTTRFFVIGRHDAGRPAPDKTSLIMSRRNRPARCICSAPLAAAGVHEPPGVPPGPLGPSGWSTCSTWTSKAIVTIRRSRPPRCPGRIRCTPRKSWAPIPRPVLRFLWSLPMRLCDLAPPISGRFPLSARQADFRTGPEMGLDEASIVKLASNENPSASASAPRGDGGAQPTSPATRTATVSS